MSGRNKPGRLMERLREIREDAGLSQQQVAAMIPAHYERISRLERGVVALRVADAEDIAAALGYDLEWRLIPRTASR